MPTSSGNPSSPQTGQGGIVHAGLDGKSYDARMVMPSEIPSFLEYILGKTLGRSGCGGVAYKNAIQLVRSRSKKRKPYTTNSLSIANTLIAQQRFPYEPALVKGTR